MALPSRQYRNVVPEARKGSTVAVQSIQVAVVPPAVSEVRNTPGHDADRSVGGAVRAFRPASEAPGGSAVRAPEPPQLPGAADGDAKCVLAVALREREPCSEGVPAEVAVPSPERRWRPRPPLMRDTHRVPRSRRRPPPTSRCVGCGGRRSDPCPLVPQPTGRCLPLSGAPVRIRLPDPRDPGLPLRGLPVTLRLRRTTRTCGIPARSGTPLRHEDAQGLVPRHHRRDRVLADRTHVCGPPILRKLGSGHMSTVDPRTTE